MRTHQFPTHPGAGSRRSLAARGQALNIFAGLGFSVALSLLALGSYLIEEQFRNPVAAGPAELLVAAVLIATALTLLCCLLRPAKTLRHRNTGFPASTPWEQKTILVARCDTGRPIEARDPVRLHGRYVDRACISIRR